jgi:hypothetical protein
VASSSFWCQSSNLDDLANVVDSQVTRSAGLRIGVDRLGGAGVQRVGLRPASASRAGTCTPRSALHRRT